MVSVGFVAAETAPGRWIGDGVASALAAVALPALRLFDPDVVRIGTELRGASGWAVRVTEVCDGHGLVISLLAVLVASAPTGREGLIRFAAGLAAIQLFNLARIIALALVLATDPLRFDAVHAVVFPLLTSALILFCVLALRHAGQVVLIAFPLALVWLALSDIASYLFVVPANLLLPFLGAEFGYIAERTAGWTLGTNLLASQGEGQVSRFLVPLRPADFTLATPILLAAALFARRYVLVVPALLLVLAAILAACFTSVWGLAAAQDEARLLLPDASGALTTQVFAPSTALRDVFALAQNVLIHLNLLVLPAVIALSGRRNA